MKPLHFFNYFFFQLFFVRLTKHMNITEEVRTYYWSFMYWVVPFSGWGSNFKYLGRKQFFYLKLGGSVKLLLTGFAQVLLVSINTVLVTKSLYVGVLATSFLISFVWSFNVKKVAFGSMTDRVFYSAGAAMGGITGVIIGNLF